MPERVLVVGPDHARVQVWRDGGHSVDHLTDAADPIRFGPQLTAIMRRVGPPTVLVLVAPPTDGPLALLSAATLAETLQRVVAGGLVAIHQVLPAMREAGAGRIQVVLDAASQDDPVSAGLRAVARGVQAEEAAHGVTVEVIDA